MNQDNAKKPPASAVLRCSGCGNLTPADIRKECEDCSHNHDFECAGGLPAVLLTGSRDNVANAVRPKGILGGYNPKYIRQRMRHANQMNFTEAAHNG